MKNLWNLSGIGEREANFFFFKDMELCQENAYTRRSYASVISFLCSSLLRIEERR
jgi:hypothetical protein